MLLTGSVLWDGLLDSRRLRSRVLYLCFACVRLFVLSLLLLLLSVGFGAHRVCLLVLELLLSRWFLLLLLSLIAVVSIAIAVITALAASDAPPLLGTVGVAEVGCLLTAGFVVVGAVVGLVGGVVGVFSCGLGFCLGPI